MDGSITNQQQKKRDPLPSSPQPASSGDVPSCPYLLGRLNVALGLQHLLSGGCVPRGRVAGGGDGLPRGCHDESRLLRVLGDEGRLEHRRGRIRGFRRALSAEADLPEGAAELVGLEWDKGEDGGGWHVGQEQ